MASVTVSAVRKMFGQIETIHGVDFTVDDGEFVVFVGPSGCGKSTLLRMIAGLEDISGGDISIGGRVVNDGYQRGHVQCSAEVGVALLG